MLPAHMARQCKPGTTKRQAPEQSLQMRVATMLNWLLIDTPWTAIGHGGGGKQRGMILKGMGVHAGWPDLMLVHRGRPCFIELKAEKGVLSTAQKAVHEQIVAAGGAVAVCRSLEQVTAVIEVWGIPTREARLSPANRAALPMPP
jgi:VRR-NUC domain